jgi:hypothetical protein
VQVEAEVIEKTHWPPSVIDEIGYDRLQEYLHYWNTKAEWEDDQREQAERRAERGGRR